MTRTASPADIGALARLIATHAPYDGIFELRVPGVHAIRVSHAATQMTHALQQMAVCIVAQGAKTVLLADNVYEYAPGRIAVYSVDVPIAAQITRATPAEPYLNLRIDLDPQKVTELALKVYPNGLPRTQESRAVFVGEGDTWIIAAAIRLLDLMARPGEAELLAPMAMDEILIRLLRSPMGTRVAELGRTDSSLQRVSKAVSWLRANYDQPVVIDDLAELVNMSVSAFHRQFKAVTSMSPLQYQKALRLQEARRLMLTAMMDAGDAGRRVGYVSASQFTREYGRFFGAAPTRDVQRMRQEGPAASDASA